MHNLDREKLGRAELQLGPRFPHFLCSWESYYNNLFHIVLLRGAAPAALSPAHIIFSLSAFLVTLKGGESCAVFSMEEERGKRFISTWDSWEGVRHSELTSCTVMPELTSSPNEALLACAFFLADTMTLSQA